MKILTIIFATLIFTVGMALLIENVQGPLINWQANGTMALLAAPLLLIALALLSGEKQR